MAKREQINGRNYSLFIDYDRDALKQHKEDWIEWFRQRVLFILIDPIGEILKEQNIKLFDNENFTIYIGITTLICCGIESMGGFYKGKACSRNFKNFVKDYMHSDFKKDPAKLEVLHNYFRCGLAHGFCIKQGGMHLGTQYFLEDKNTGLQISTIELFKDFKQAFYKYINNLNKAHKSSTILENFYNRFGYVFILGK